jgi:hypothetical protein
MDIASLPPYRPGLRRAPLINILLVATVVALLLLALVVATGVVPDATSPVDGQLVAPFRWPSLGTLG